MKRAIRCLSCDKIKRYSHSYAVRVAERTKSMLTGEAKESEVLGRICGDCAELAGYKVKKRK